MIDYQNELNEEQLDAVWHGDGPCLVLAGAGSGKTRVITYRVAYLLEKGIKPENILLVTFTNKAADEMKSRLEKLVGQLSSPSARPARLDDASRSGGEGVGGVGAVTATSSATPPEPPLGKRGILPWAGTFHHIAYKILRQFAPLLEYKNNFTVLDSDDSETLIKLCAKPFKSDADKRKFPSASILQNIISYARNSESTIYDVLELRNPQWQMFAEQIKSIADDYYLKKKEANAMDFDDLLVNFLLLLSPSAREGVGGVGADISVPTAVEDPRFTIGTTPSRSLLERGRYNESLSLVGQKFANQFKYILVDEYQDTNRIQASIIKKLASFHKNILVVGDDAQSIYSFRAADIANILQFEKDYPNAKIFKLETNYRSSQEILQVANEVIANNVKQYKKELKTLSASGLKPALHPQMDQGGEAEFVAQKILELVEQGTPENEIAVLFRAAHHSQMLEMELVKAGIVYDYRGGLRFFERAHVKDVLAYLRILNNFSDTSAWMRVLMHEEGIGPAAAGKIVQALKRATNVEDVKIIGQQVLGEKAKNGWYNFVRIWEAMLENKSRTDASALIDAIVNSPYKDYLETEFLDSKDRLEDIAQLQVFAKKYNELEQFLAEAILTTDYGLRTTGSEQPVSPPARGGVGGGGSGKIVLSTIHQAKGLEWSAVFIINLASGAFPSDRALREDNGLEEERRLFYVAVTRAKKHLYLTYPMEAGLGHQSFLDRHSFSDGGSDGGPSLFLGEISSDLLDDHSLLSMGNGLVLNDEAAGVTYESENKPLRIKPGSFLRSVEDL